MDSQYSQDELDNYSNQLNPNNDAYWTSRGYDGRSDDWDDEDCDNLDWDDEDCHNLGGEYFDDNYDNCDYEDWCSDDFDV